MLPVFPNFKRLQFSDKADIEQITRQYQPFSDFNFVSMWSWNIAGNILVSQLKGNLAIRFADYISGEFFYTCIGSNELNETCSELLKLSTQQELAPALKLLPEFIAEKLDRNVFLVKEDPDHTDYVLAIDRLATYDGPELASKRRQVSHFMRRAEGFEFKLLDLDDPEIDRQIRALFSRWLVQKNLDNVQEEEHEYRALSRCLESALRSEIITTGVYVGNELSAFWMLQDLANTYSISHFEKADTSLYAGIFPYLKLHTAKMLRERGVEYMNLEQDLGIMGLRMSKLSYAPKLFLKKYNVTFRT